ncbi:MAG TPA: PilZ domain-containing protein [Candidatus Krumholzibacteria bacterium]|nr:PilZ domain-containing protein [Candidatus Krumholzibacteria bacterium]HPD70158.1 PilZ domain-containing protein [Candidatus Krumholzibacteria bacterium]HRY40142.1 PilZ domain-containing protein [Candidatus Krumholzibacteria bacterium]
MEERRRHERFATVFPAEVTDRETGRIVGLVADISAGGLMLRAEKPLGRGRILRLVVELPLAGGEKRTTGIEVRVRWCEEDLEPATYVVGLEFTGTTPAGCPLAKDLLRALKDLS